eukprot:SAG11_NODE_6811_length_1243_cov_1.371503_1_plen_199_part_00
MRRAYLIISAGGTTSCACGGVNGSQVNAGYGPHSESQLLVEVSLQSGAATVHSLMSKTALGRLTVSERYLQLPRSTCMPRSTSGASPHEGALGLRLPAQLTQRHRYTPTAGRCRQRRYHLWPLHDWTVLALCQRLEQTAMNRFLSDLNLMAISENVGKMCRLRTTARARTALRSPTFPVNGYRRARVSGFSTSTRWPT